jgi:hypothetical protein
MSVFPKPAQLLESYYGFTVAGGAKTLPASTTGHLFTVAGGRVLVTSMMGLVTTAIQSQACTLSIGNTPTAGTASVNSIATAIASISGLAVGVSFGVSIFSGGPPVPAALIATGTSGVLPGQNFGYSLDDGGICVAPAGTIDWVTNATNTGAVSWILSYIPIDAGATITAM